MNNILLFRAKINKKDKHICFMITGGARFWTGTCEIRFMKEIQDIPICVVDCMDYPQIYNFHIYEELIKKYAKKKYNISLMGFSAGGLSISHIVANLSKEYQKYINNLITFDSPFCVKN